MRAGDFEAAWQLTDAQLRSGTLQPHVPVPRHLQRVWTGAPLEGQRVLVRCYHGLGDTIQFIRYAPLLRHLAREVIVWAQPELLPLLQGVQGIDRLLPLHDGTPDVSYDVDIEVMELPHALRTLRSSIPADVPYIDVAPHAGGASSVREKRDGGLAVGMVWQAGDWDSSRSVPAALLQPIARIPGVALHLLQRGSALHAMPTNLGVNSGSDDILETARTMRALDLVVSVDSMPAHLAGALAVPVWTLLRADADWRWMQGPTSPWYPTMRLFRQETEGEWTPVLERVARDLTALCQQV